MCGVFVCVRSVLKTYNETEVEEVSGFLEPDLTSGVGIDRERWTAGAPPNPDISWVPAGG